jgi:hypothetical protein
VSTALVYLFKGTKPYEISAIMTIGLLINSLWMLFSSYKLSKRLYNFSVPYKEITSSVSAMVIVVLGYVGIIEKRELRVDVAECCDFDIYVHRITLSVQPLFPLSG